MEEVWKSVPVLDRVWPDGSPFYEVSNLGGVRTSGHETFRGGWRAPVAVKQQTDKLGYLFVRLARADLRVCSLYVHCLVAMAFVDNPHKYKQVSHINGDIHDNSASNVMWVDEGGLEADFTHRSTDLMANGEYSENGIRQYSYTGELLETYRSSLDVQDAMNCRGGIVSDYCRRKVTGRLKLGYVWRYVDDDELFELSIEERRKAIGLRPIRQYDPHKGFVQEFPSIMIAAESVGERGGITRCCQRKQLTSGGFLWRYSDDDEFAGGVSVTEFWFEHYTPGGRGTIRR